MREFKINEDQINVIFKVLSEVKCGVALPAIDALRGLSEIKNENKDKKNNQ
tara:strand:+ start:115 stop:267 length:153 start_codon:yes stop_codon:yes gene_type:complete